MRKKLITLLTVTGLCSLFAFSVQTHSAAANPFEQIKNKVQGFKPGNGPAQGMSGSQAQRIKSKAQTAQATVKQQHREGRDVSSQMQILKQVKPAMDARDFDKAERLLDTVLAQLDQEWEPSAPASDEQTTKLFGKPRRVTIRDYSSDAMEPFISRDGRYMFFNNLNDPNVNTDLHYATRIDELTFEYQGILDDIATSSLEAVATMDESGKFYYVSPTGWPDLIYRGDFDDGQITNVEHVTGLGDASEGHVLGPEISPDGQTLYYVRAQKGYTPGVPGAMDIKIATYEGGRFVELPNSDDIMKNINTDDLEYAPAISSNGLELYFTRAASLIVGNASSGRDLRVLMARRNSISEAFGEPKRISAIRGFVEGPTITDDGKSLYYHKKDGDRFVLYKVERRL